jgi:hypothetical protein
MEAYKAMDEESPRNLATKTSFFTRKLAYKLEQRGVTVPQSVMIFLDTPMSALGEQESTYFEKKFCPLIPSIVSALEEVFNEVGADIEGWEDMMTYGSKQETPIKICATAVLIKKEREANDVVTLKANVEQRTKKIALPSWFNQLSSNPT